MNENTRPSKEPPATPPVADRRGFLRRSLVIGAASAPLVAAATATPAKAGPSTFTLNGEEAFLLRMAYFDILGHERDHVNELLTVLGDSARPKPTFQNLLQPKFRTFRDVSQNLENTGAGAYLGAAPAINSPTILAAAGSIALIEARHAGVLNFLDPVHITASVLAPDVDRSFEQPLTQQQVIQLAGPFIKDLNGGPPLAYDPDPANRSDANDIDILNFALALEFLERDFYTLNLAVFYPNFFQKNAQ